MRSKLLLYDYLIMNSYCVTLRTKRNLVHHLETHTKERKFECFECKKCFKTKNNLRQHMSCHGPPKYECEVCGNKFSFNQGLLNHVRAIHGLKLPAPKQPVSEESTDVPVSDDSMDLGMDLFQNF